MTAHRIRVHLPAATWPFSLRALLALLASHHALALAAKPFPVDQFSYYLSDYDFELARIAKELKRTEPEIQARHRRRRRPPATPGSPPPRSNSC